MEKIVVTGGTPLSGEVRVSGSKNSALALMAAALVAEGPTVLENVPDIGDIQVMCNILTEIGCSVRWCGDHALEIDSTHLSPATDSKYLSDLVRKMRASFTILGPLLARLGESRVPLPGGCAIGTRSIDFHVKGLQSMGAEVVIEHGFVIARATELHGANILLDSPSVGATNHLLSTAVLARGRTIIENAAQEPEIMDLSRMLVAMGAKIRGAGTHRIEVEGVRELKPVRHHVIPDRIEAASFMIAAAATQGDVVVRNVVEDHVLPIILKMRECGIEIVPDGPPLRVLDAKGTSVPVRSMRVTHRGRVQGVHITAAPHPGFPTDVHPVMASLLSLAQGTSLITETVYDRRFRYCAELQRMGAMITVTGQNAVIEGVERLTGAQVSAPDLRGGAALVLAGLCAHGQTEVTQIHYVDRGYEAFVSKLTALGADVTREAPAIAISDRRPALSIV